MSESIKAETRTEFGKGAARRIRREAKVPAVMYGHGNDPIHLTLPGHETKMAIKHGGANALLEIEVDGTAHLALTKQVQVDPVRRTLEHVDFVAVRRGEKVTVEVPIVVVGEAERGTFVDVDLATIQLEAEATHIPEQIEVDITGAAAGTQFLAGAITLPSGSTLLTDPEALVVNVTVQAAEEPAADADAAAAGETAEAGDSE